MRQLALRDQWDGASPTPDFVLQKGACALGGHSRSTGKRSVAHVLTAVGPRAGGWTTEAASSVLRVGSSWFFHLEASESFNAGSSDALALSQIHAALRGCVPQHREANGGQGGEWNSLKRKIISLC